MVFLSFCIPSYNRAQFLPDLLQSIVLQYDERVEIVICDNGSVDETRAVALEWQSKYPRIVYERLEVNAGPDRCILKSVEKASGIYCWLMGDDDILEPGGLRKVLEMIEKHPELTGLTVNRAAYDFSLQKRWMEPDSVKRKKDQLFSDPKECFKELFTLFGFLSAQIVEKKSWTKVVEEEISLPSYYNAYALIYIIGRMIQKKPCWLFLHTPCIGWRSGNDSFAKELGVYRRFVLDVVGYLQITKALFKEDSFLYRNLMNQICSLHLVAHVRGMKWNGFLRGKLWIEAFFLSCSKLSHLRSFWYPFLPVFLSPTWALRVIRFIYRNRCRDR